MKEIRSRRPRRVRNASVVEARGEELAAGHRDPADLAASACEIVIAPGDMPGEPDRSVWTACEVVVKGGYGRAGQREAGDLAARGDPSERQDADVPDRTVGSDGDLAGFVKGVGQVVEADAAAGSDPSDPGIVIGGEPQRAVCRQRDIAARLVMAQRRHAEGAERAGRRDPSNGVIHREPECTARIGDDPLQRDPGVGDGNERRCDTGYQPPDARAARKPQRAVGARHDSVGRVEATGQQQLADARRRHAAKATDGGSRGGIPQRPVRPGRKRARPGSSRERDRPHVTACCDPSQSTGCSLVARVLLGEPQRTVRAERDRVRALQGRRQREQLDCPVRGRSRDAARGQDRQRSHREPQTGNARAGRPVSLNDHVAPILAPCQPQMCVLAPRRPHARSGGKSTPPLALSQQSMATLYGEPVRWI